jgi:hypothetical protein
VTGERAELLITIAAAVKNLSPPLYVLAMREE